MPHLCMSPLHISKYKHLQSAVLLPHLTHSEINEYHQSRQNFLPLPQTYVQLSAPTWICEEHLNPEVPWKIKLNYIFAWQEKRRLYLLFQVHHLYISPDLIREPFSGKMAISSVPHEGKQHAERPRKKFWFCMDLCKNINITLSNLPYLHFLESPKSVELYQFQQICAEVLAFATHWKHLQVSCVQVLAGGTEIFWKNNNL